MPGPPFSYTMILQRQVLDRLRWSDLQFRVRFFIETALIVGGSRAVSCFRITFKFIFDKVASRKSSIRPIDVPSSVTRILISAATII